MVPIETVEDVIEVYREGLIDMDESRALLGLPGESLEQENGRLLVEIKRLREKLIEAGLVEVHGC